MKLAGVRSRHFLISKTAKSDLISDLRIPRDPIGELHAHFIRTHQHRNPNAMSKVIKSYALNQTSMQKSRSAFVEIDHPTLPIWNHMIRGLSQSDRPVDALDLFDKMREQGLRGDNLTFIFACKACGRVSDVLYGKRVHDISAEVDQIRKDMRQLRVPLLKVEKFAFVRADDKETTVPLPWLLSGV
ncbi:Pentatricopeptide repeat-containing protein, mitochondrial [Sesamum alatum]|uniref:Pentatricopeptide repeat-containing protein, mitochondrial n=1 Tax=Sesamum alatum TaxID=300844 RepID=A0AAE1YUA8_9LAMI|nr:Pentatricopeptide repeat-containing protein, mitochondrial [Sesamum alatum]